MIEKAKQIVRDYVLEHINTRKFTNNTPLFDVFIVWQCKTLQNWKFLLSTDIGDGMYYELTYNGNDHVFYLDAYIKVENRCIKDFGL